MRYFSVEDLARNNMNVIEVLCNNMPVGVIVFNRKMEMVFSNRKAVLFLKRYKLPEELLTVSGRIFEAIRTLRFKEMFPGEVHIYKKIEGSPNSWTFSFVIYDEGSDPHIGIFIIEEAISRKLDIGKIRQDFRITRRETDVLRRLLDGLKNLEIAEELDMSEQTVKDHLSNIYMKIGVENRFSLVRYLMNREEY
jgi:DNA-binding CsgD family transcriptional regulator